MPIIKTISVNKSRTVAIWHIIETTQELLNELKPNDDDIRLLQSFKNENKKQEWLAGRLTLKYLCDNLELNYAGVSKDENGKPSLNDHPHEISITHSHPYVGAIIDQEK